jgi:hypothetical protein
MEVFQPKYLGRAVIVQEFRTTCTEGNYFESQSVMDLWSIQCTTNRVSRDAGVSNSATPEPLNSFFPEELKCKFIVPDLKI